MGAGVTLAELLVAVEYDNSKTDRALSETQQKVKGLGDEFEKTEKKAGLSAKEQARAVESLQRQRSSALIKQMRDEEQARVAAAKSLAEQKTGFEGLLGSINPVTLGVTAATGAVLALAAAFAQIIGDTIETGSQLNDLSLKTGLTVETLSGLKLQLKQSGSDLDTFGRAVFVLEKNLGEAADGNKELKRTFADLGIKDAKAGLQDVDGSVRTVFKSLGALDEGARNHKGAKVLSKSMQELSAFIADTGGDIDAVIAKAQEMGLVMSGRAAADADRLGDELDALSARATMFGVNIGSQVVPTILHALDEANGGFEGHAGVVGTVVASVVYYLEQEIDKLAALANLMNSIGRIGAATYAGGLGGGIDAALASEQERQGRKVESQVLGDTAALEAMAKRFGKKPPAGGGGGGGGKKGGGGGGADKSLQDRLRMLSLEERAVEMSYAREANVIDRFYDRRLTSLETYTQDAIDAEDTRFNGVMAILREELALAGKFSKDRVLKEAEAKQKIAQEEQNHGITVSRLLDAQYQKEQAAKERHVEAILRIDEAGDAYRLDALRDRASRETFNQTEIADDLTKIELAAFERRRKALQDELVAKEQNKEDSRVVKDELGLMEVEYTALVLAQSRRRRDALESEWHVGKDDFNAADSSTGVDGKFKPPDISGWRKYFSDHMSEIADDATNILGGALDHIKEGFFSSLLSGFIDTLNQMAQELMRSALRDLLFTILKAGIGAIGGGGGSKGAGAVGGTGGKAGFFAEGGDYPANRPRVTGERGIELDFPGRAGQIISNEEIRAAVGAGEAQSGGRGFTINGGVNFSFPHVKDRREAKATEAQMARAFFGLLERHSQFG